MANKAIFTSTLPADITLNNASGVAYALSEKAALTQYVMTGTFNGTFYADAAQDTARVLALAANVDETYLAKLAVFARERGYMKDGLALLVALLSKRSPPLFDAVFDRVIDNSKMLRTFVQLIRSGVTGRKSLGSLPKRKVANWLNCAGELALVNAVGQDPSIGDVIKLSRPKATHAARAALFGHLIGKVDANAALLPGIVKELAAFKRGETDVLPKVEFRLLTQFDLTPAQWKDIARSAPWQMMRMNLNTFARHGVFDDTELVGRIADRLRDATLIQKAMALPYQLLAAYMNVSEGVPLAVREALQDAAEVAVANVPAINGQVYVFPDVSGSMQSPVTGYRKGSSSKVRCVDVAALVAASVLRRNPSAEIIPFEGQVVTKLRLSPRDSILTNAEKLAAVGGGSTNCSAPLALLNERRAGGDVLIYVSDNESWIDAGRAGRTATTNEWLRFKARNPAAKLVCIDVVPNASIQARTGDDVLNIGGFSDVVFDLLARFSRGEGAGDGFLSVVDEVVL